MTVKKCPFCAEEIAEEAIKCKHCGSMFDGHTAVHDYPPPMVTAPMIVSACWNGVTAIGWAVFVPCFGLVIAVPYALLAYYEYSTFQRAAELPPQELHDRCGVLAILQIVLGLTNLVPVICGVLLLVYRDQLLGYEESPSV